MMNNVVSLHNAAPFAAAARAAFSAALNMVDKVVPKRSTLPILSSVRLEAKGGIMTITGTDLDIEFKVTMPIFSDSTDMVAIMPATDLRTFLKMAVGDHVKITSSEDGEHARLTCGASSIEVAVHEDANWPSDNLKVERKGSVTLKISPSAFWAALDGVRPAISTEETRYYLRGVGLHSRPDGITLVTTDGHRLHRQVLRLPPNAKLEKEAIIIPVAVVNLLHSVIETKSYGEDLVILIHQESKMVRFTLANMVITAKLVDGIFPDYERLIPASSPTKVAIDGDALGKLLKAGAGKGVTAKLAFFPERCQLSFHSADAGISMSDLDATLEGDPMIVGFNAKYLHDIVRMASPSGGMVTFMLQDPGSPVRITGSERRFDAVCMPMRV